VIVTGGRESVGTAGTVFVVTETGGVKVVVGAASAVAPGAAVEAGAGVALAGFDVVEPSVESPESQAIVTATSITRSKPRRKLGMIDPPTARF